MAFRENEENYIQSFTDYLNNAMNNLIQQVEIFALTINQLNDGIKAVYIDDVKRLVEGVLKVSLQAITVNNDVYTISTIEDYAFANCENLAKVDFGNCEVREIGNNAFEYCMSLKSIWLPNSIETMGSQVFYGIGETDYDGETGEYTYYEIWIDVYVEFEQNEVPEYDDENESGWNSGWTEILEAFEMGEKYGYTYNEYKAAIGEV